MSDEKAQAFWAPGGATLRLPPRMRLANAERERLWKGLERFVNCSDLESDYQALGRAFPDFWPAEIWHYPNQEGRAVRAPSILGTITAESKSEMSEDEIRQMQWESQIESLNWHARCHKLFLFYRDTLKDVWRDGRSTADLADASPMGWLGGHAHEFLLGLTDYNDEAREAAKNERFDVSFVRPHGLDCAWQEILERFPTAAAECRVQITMLWGLGDFSLVPNNDFQRAFYLLFRQNWRARECERCNMLFVARKPKQVFCGTACSAGSRLASKLKWWNRRGAKQRANAKSKSSKGRKPR